MNFLRSATLLSQPFLQDSTIDALPAQLGHQVLPSNLVLLLLLQIDNDKALLLLQITDVARVSKIWIIFYSIELFSSSKSLTSHGPEEAESATEEVKKSKHVLRKIEKRQQGRTLDPHIEEQFGSERLMACISSRPGQCDRADGYILEGKELEFYMKKLQRKKGKGVGAAA